MGELCKAYFFRLDISQPQLGGPGLFPIRVITALGPFWLDPTYLAKGEKKLFVRYVALLIPYNCLTRRVQGDYLFEPYTYYPSKDLMNAVQWLQASHNTQEILIDQMQIDKDAYALLWGFQDSEEYKQGSEKIIQELRR